MRATARPISTLPFTGGPSLLAFHPALAGTLLVASSNGLFGLVDAARGAELAAHVHQARAAAAWWPRGAHCWA